MKKNEFDGLVNQAMSEAGLGAMRPVIEKEIMHYEIFNALDSAGLLKGLVFQGGTSLRLCRGSDRFSEDLDFAGGIHYDVSQFSDFKKCLEDHIGSKFDLPIRVKEPREQKSKQEIDNITVDRWWVNVQTSPGRPDIKAQKIKIEIANVMAHTKELVPIKNNYQFLTGSPTVLVNAETMDEVLADKVLAFPTSMSKSVMGAFEATPDRIRHRDIWDMAWLTAQGAKLDISLLEKKINDYQVKDYTELLKFSERHIQNIAKSDSFTEQMNRFVSGPQLQKTLERDGYREFLGNTCQNLLRQALSGLEERPSSRPTKAP